MGLCIIGVVEPCRQHIGTDHDTAADFFAETCGSGGSVHVLKARTIWQIAQAEADAVIARQIGRCFGWRDDIIGRQSIFGVRQADIDDFRAGVF